MDAEVSKRAIIYARYSNDLQSASSVEDQIDDCKKYAMRNGWKIVAEYSDSAMSGATMHRPGIAAALEDASNGRCDLILAESLDRISRDLGDMAKFFQQLQFHRVVLHTLAERDVSTLHVGLKGTMNAQFLSDMAAKIRRGQRGLIRNGRSAGGLSYGYEVSIGPDRSGKNGERGYRRINEKHAEVVRRIFSEYVAGSSPYQIARSLNADGIPAPRGGSWNVSSIVGHRKRKVGILHNELYAGRLIYNRLTMVKDPATGKRLSRENPKEDWVIESVPDLTIVDEETWDKAQKLKLKNGGGRMARHARRPKHLLSGLVVCSSCGGNMIGAGANKLICTNAHNKGTCNSSRKLNRGLLEFRVIEHLRGLLAHPDAIKIFDKHYKKQIIDLRKDIDRRKVEDQRELSNVSKKIERLIKLVEASDHLDLEDVGKQIAALEAKRKALSNQPEVKEDSIPGSIPLDGAHALKMRLENLEQILADDLRVRMAAIQSIRSLIEKIVVLPEKRQGVAAEVLLWGRLAQFLGVQPEIQVNKNGTNKWEYLVAGEGFEPPTNGL